MFTPPTAEHAWLKNFVGTWTFESTCNMGPDQPPMKSGGTETVRMLGDLWVVGESTGTMPGGGDMNAIMTVGFDPATKKYRGTWVGSPMAYMFVYEGDRPNNGNRLDLYTDGPSMAGDGTMTVYRDSVELITPDKRLLTSGTKTPDGQFHEFMRAEYRRVK
ncbi:MAG: DUF1579 domain-containing protein [Phycisphaerales bacterium]|nr:DUF1579 domain-containing protein [Phycisphaerales bacterium]